MRTDSPASAQLVALHERRGRLPRRFSYRAKAWPGAPKGTGRARERLRCRRSSRVCTFDEQAWRTEEPGVRARRLRPAHELHGRAWRTSPAGARDPISKLHAELRNKSRNISPYCVIRHAGCLVGRRIRCHAGCRVGRRIRCHAGYLVGRRKRCRVSCLVEGRVGCRMGCRAGWHVE